MRPCVGAHTSIGVPRRVEASLSRASSSGVHGVGHIEPGLGLPGRGVLPRPGLAGRGVLPRPGLAGRGVLLACCERSSARSSTAWSIETNASCSQSSSSSSASAAPAVPSSLGTLCCGSHRDGSPSKIGSSSFDSSATGGSVDPTQLSDNGSDFIAVSTFVQQSDMGMRMHIGRRGRRVAGMCHTIDWKALGRGRFGDGVADGSNAVALWHPSKLKHGSRKRIFLHPTWLSASGGDSIAVSTLSSSALSDGHDLRRFRDDSVSSTACRISVCARMCARALARAHACLRARLLRDCVHVCVCMHACLALLRDHGSAVPEVAVPSRLCLATPLFGTQRPCARWWRGRAPGLADRRTGRMW